MKRDVALLLVLGGCSEFERNSGLANALPPAAELSIGQIPVPPGSAAQAVASEMTRTARFGDAMIALARELAEGGEATQADSVHRFERPLSNGSPIVLVLEAMEQEPEAYLAVLDVEIGSERRRVMELEGRFEGSCRTGHIVLAPQALAGFVIREGPVSRVVAEYEFCDQTRIRQQFILGTGDTGVTALDWSLETTSDGETQVTLAAQLLGAPLRQAFVGEDQVKVVLRTVGHSAGRLDASVGTSSVSPAFSECWESKELIYVRTASLSLGANDDCPVELRRSLL